MTKQEEVEVRLLNDSHLSLKERIKLVSSEKIKVKKTWNFNRAISHLLCKYMPEGYGFITHKKVIDDHMDELEDLMNHVIQASLEVKPQVTRVVPNLEETDWIEYDHTVKGHYPDKYGMYLIARSNGKGIKFNKWGIDRWQDLQDKQVSHFRLIYGPMD